MTVSEYNRAVDLHADSIYRYLVKQLEDADKAQDILQDVFEKVWIKVDTISFEKSKSYLFSAAYRTMIDYIRKEKKIEITEDYKGYNIGVEKSTYSDLSEQLNKALDKLPDIQKSVILLRDYEGYTYEEIGDIMELSESQVKVYIYRARKFLQEFLVSIETLL